MRLLLAQEQTQNKLSCGHNAEKWAYTAHGKTLDNCLAKCREKILEKYVRTTCMRIDFPIRSEARPSALSSQPNLHLQIIHMYQIEAKAEGSTERKKPERSAHWELRQHNLNASGAPAKCTCRKFVSMKSHAATRGGRRTHQTAG